MLLIYGLILFIFPILVFSFKMFIQETIVLLCLLVSSYGWLPNIIVNNNHQRAVVVGWSWDPFLPQYDLHKGSQCLLTSLAKYRVEDSEDEDDFFVTVTTNTTTTIIKPASKNAHQSWPLLLPAHLLPQVHSTT
ncbi:hypothetical protein BKA57DRAFT_166577 [Linnemannia elongata]|nr:hypothetical protein BKA57DRAFT_166577 [Linnemannia elongata]